jgi:ParB-like chromosome segregation protein Spo0J
MNGENRQDGLFEIIQVNEIVVERGFRDHGADIESLTTSILKVGLLQPIVLQREEGMVRLVAGSRQLAAVKRIGWSNLLHGREFVWRGETEATLEGFQC